MLHCSFRKAAVGTWVQHFGGVEVRNADKVSFRCNYAYVCFRPNRQTAFLLRDLNLGFVVRLKMEQQQPHEIR